MENPADDTIKIDEILKKHENKNKLQMNKSNKDENENKEEKKESENIEDIQKKINNEEIDNIIEKEEMINNIKNNKKKEENGDNNIINEEEEKKDKIEKIDENKIEIKDDSLSDNTNSNKDNISLRSNSNRNLSGYRINSDVDLDKIIAGKDESPNNINNTQDNLEEFKIEQKDSEEEGEEDFEENCNSTFYYLGNIFRDVVNKKKNEIKDSRPSIYKKNIGEETQNINFGEIINAQISEIKENTLSYFEKTIKELEKRYNTYINKMTNYINENELKLSKVFQKDVKNEDNLLEFADNNIFKQVDNVLEIHENIFNAIEGHIKLLNIFLRRTDLLLQKNPLEYFVNSYSNDILNCWFLNKINYQKLNLSKVILNKDLSELCSGYLCKKKDNNFSCITIQRDSKGNISLESEFAKENLNNLEKLKFQSLNNEEINSHFKNINQKNNDNNIYDIIPSANKLSSLSIIDSDFSSTNISAFSAPELKKLKIKKTPLTLQIQNFLESILGHTLFLQKLYLEKCFLDDQSLFQIFEFLSEKTQFTESLQNISFSGNEITLVDMNILIEKKSSFKSLNYLDFSKNNIFDFYIDNFKCLPKLNVLDLTDNNISNFIFFQAVKSQKRGIESINLLCNNIFLNNNKLNANKYRLYLQENLAKFRHKIKKLNLSFLYDKKTINQMIQLKISPMVKISLIKLNLSYCGLSDKNFCEFLKNNFGLLNLEELNLSNNLLTIKIFNLILKVDTSFEKLTKLDLSMNNINSLSIDEYSDIERFVEKYSTLKKIKLQESTFCQDLLLLSQLEKEKCEAINNKLIEKEVKFIVETDYNILIVPLKQLFELKDKDNL